VLDAQYFGVAQRRRRVFVVGHLGDWRRAAAVLFERESLRVDPAPSRAKGQGTAADAQAGARAGLHATVGALCADTHPGAYSGQDAYTGRLVPAAFSIREDATVGNFSATPLDIANALQAHQPAPSSHHAQTFVAHAAVATTMAVRRLTPVECDRLQGFPDGYTAIPWRGKPATECPDGPRYRALGNSMAVPCMSWIGKRIAQVDALPQPM
jgi:DNA (cytosine-5)-methyltransferase 1